MQARCEIADILPTMAKNSSEYLNFTLGISLHFTELTSSQPASFAMSSANRWLAKLAAHDCFTDVEKVSIIKRSTSVKHLTNGTFLNDSGDQASVAYQTKECCVSVQRAVPNRSSKFELGCSICNTVQGHRWTFWTTYCRPPCSETFIIQVSSANSDY